MNDLELLQSIETLTKGRCNYCVEHVNTFDVELGEKRNIVRIIVHRGPDEAAMQVTAADNEHALGALLLAFDPPADFPYIAPLNLDLARVQTVEEALAPESRNTKLASLFDPQP